MRLGILLPTREAVLSGGSEAAPLLEMAERAEAAGFDSVWVGDSILARPRFEPLTLLAAVAARTHRVTLGTAVLLPALRHPLVLAHLVATLDRLSEGRLVLGVGIATDNPPIRKEFEAAGSPFSQRVGRCLEILRICRALWGSERATFKGRYWTLEDAELLPKPARPGGPPIWMGGSGETALRAAGASFDGWFPISPTAADFRKGWERVQAEARAAGRDPAAVTPALYTTVRLDRDVAAARETMRRFIEAYYMVPYERIAARQGCYAGTVEGCVEWLTGFREAGARHVVLRFAGADQLSQLEQAASGFLRRLRGPD
ncbi:MAG: LLM class flavin-dependent oxidoreductase [Candidatus Rokubacteria bacterium]|nr:LLM class flavin-dependent oxidoreductase [Candidatus Rokubacteria bacterium]